MSQFFAAPGMLLWTLAAGVPILIHLLSRRRFDRVAWAAMDFLLRAFKRTRKRLRIENLLLLLLRVLLLLLLAFALADPQVASSALFGDSASDVRSSIIVIDTSFSMDARDATDTSAFAKAQRQARRILEELDTETDYAAIVTSGTPAHLVQPLVNDVARARASIDALRISQGTTDTLAALKIVHGLLAAPETRREHTGQKSIFVLTDMQKLQFLGSSTDGEERPDSTEPLRPDAPDPIYDRVLRDIKELGGQVVFVDVGIGNEARFPNVAVTDIKQVGKAFVRGQRATFEVRVRNFGDQTASGDLLFAVDNEESFVQKERVTALPGRATAAVAETEQSFLFHHEFTESGYHHLTLRWADDSLKTDNVRRYAFFVPDWIRVLCVSGSNHRDITESSTFFAARALDPAVGLGRPGSSSFKVTEISAIEFSSTDVEDYDVVLLADVSALAPPKLAQLEEFVRGGGALIWLSGSTMEGADRTGENGSVNALFHKDGQGLLPASIVKTIGHEENHDDPWFIQFDDLEHPAVGYFKDEKIQPSLTRMPVLKFFETKIDDAPTVRLIASLHREKSSGIEGKTYPFLVERTFGKGSVMMFTTSATTNWNLLATSPAFVPLMREMASAMVRARTRRNVMVGESVVERFDPAVGEVLLRRGKEPELTRTTSLSPDKSAAELSLPRLDACEIVTLEIPKTDTAALEREKSATRKLAVNVDPSESDLERADRDWLVAQFGTELMQIIGENEEISTRAGRGDDSSIWKFLLYGMILFLLVETVFAQRFSRQERQEFAA